MNKTKKQLLPLILSVLILSFLTAYWIFAFTDAPGSPPECPAGYPGCDAPINVGSTAQTKSGALSVSTLTIGYGQTSGNIYLADGADEEGDINKVDQIIGRDDLRFCRSSAQCAIDADIWLDSSGNVRLLTGNLYASKGISTFGTTVTIGTVEATEFCLDDAATECVSGTWPTGMSETEDYGRSGVATNLYEGTDVLSSKYLGITAKADDSDKLDNHDSSYFLDTSATAQTKSGTLTINTSGNDKIKFRGTQASPHTIWLGDSKGVRFWDSVNGELMRISNTGVVSIPNLSAGCAVDSNTSGELVCGTDAVNDSVNSSELDYICATNNKILKRSGGNWICADDATGVAGIQGGGTLNYLSKFTDTGTIGNSQIFDDGTNVNISGDLTVSGASTNFRNAILAVDGAGSGIDADKLDNISSGNFLRSNANDTFTGKLSVGSTSARQAGIYGLYDSTKIGHVWSMGTAYAILADGTTFGNLYGMAYCHTNNANCKAGYGHQLDIASNGTVGIALGMTGNAWFAGTVTATTLSGNLSCTNCVNATEIEDIYLFNNASDTMDGGTNTTLTILSNDTGQSKLELRGDNQGTGYVYVGQSASHGGGIVYNGDDNPNLPFTTDHVSLFRRTVSVDYEVMHWAHNSNDITMTGSLTMDGDLTVKGNDIYGSGSLVLRGAGGGYVEAKSNSATWGLIVRDYNSSNYGNIDANSGYLAIGYNNANGPLFVSDNDRVGIGDSTPGYKLDVAGDIRATGTIRGGSLGRRNCAWTTEQMGGDHFCPDGTYMAGFTQRIWNDFWSDRFKLYQKLYCCYP